MTVKVKVDFRDCLKAVTGLQQEQPVRKMSDIATGKTQKHLHSKAPSKTGKFASSFERRRSSKGMLLETKYGNLFTWLEWTGTKPHLIVPVKARVLHWIDPESGEHMFRYKVNHPGTRAKPFVRPALPKITASTVGEYVHQGVKRRHNWIK